MFAKELEAAEALARSAGETILSFYHGEIEAEDKIGPDDLIEPVTEADRAASRIIVEGIARAFPADAVLSEEEWDDTALRLKSKRVWIIDPIDGTAGFIKKDGDFAVHIGLAEEGEPVAGVVHLPFHDLTYFAAKGEGAFTRGPDKSAVSLTVSSKTEPGVMKLAVSRNHRSPKISRIMEEIGFEEEVQRGSVGLKIGLIANQICDAYIHLSPRTKLWDTCAPQVILHEAGGRLTDLFGQPYRYDVGDVRNWGGIVASNGVSHDDLIERLRPILNEFGRLQIKGRMGVTDIP